MANIVMGLDTKDDKLDLTINGKRVSDVTGVFVHRFVDFEGKFQYEVIIESLGDSNDDDLVHQTMRITRADSRETKANQVVGKVFPFDGTDDLVYSFVSKK